MLVTPDDAFNAQMLIIKPEEGAYSNDPNDPGGETAWGCVAADWQAFGYTGSIKDATWADAVLIYKQKYWLEPMLDKIAGIDIPIARKLLDTGINQGTRTANEYLQQCLTLLSANGTAFPGPNGVDGALGGRTRSSMQAFITLRGNTGRAVLLFMIASMQSSHYNAIEIGNPSQGEYEYGWQVRAMNYNYGV